MSTSPQSMKRPFEDPSDTSNITDIPTKKGRSSSNVSSPNNIPSIFNDPAGKGCRIPTISRKVRACSACKKQKIRCDFEDGESTCVRCKKMKLDCVVNRSLQTILDEDVEWKHQMREDTAQLQNAVDDILGKLGLRQLSEYDPRASSPAVSTTSTEHRTVVSHHPPTRLPLGKIKVENDDMHGAAAGGVGMMDGRRESNATEREGSQEPHDHVGSTLVSNPMGSLYEVTRFRGLRTSWPGGYRHPSEIDRDFISRGIISQAEGEELFEIFRDSLNHYLYGIALTHNNLESARASSCLLSAAIFTVASLHLPQHHHLYSKCCHEFLTLVSTSMFDRRHRLDDVRALCIGAFWLADLSWKLSGHAVRIATELGVHQSFRKALAGSSEHFERARLWYLLYVCDHHFSIAYGRPPVIHDTEPMREWEKFVKSSQAIEGDSRVCCQVSLFVILTRVYNFYEAEAEKEISDENLKELASFNEQLDQWRTRWMNKLGIPSSCYGGYNQSSNGDAARNSYVGDYPSQGVDLHYNFAKLQVNSLSLRGASTSTINNPSALRKEHANIAINSAFSVLSVVLEESDIRYSLVGVPLCVTTMIAFAAVFLLKVTARWRGIGFSPLLPEQVWKQVERVINMLKEKRAGEQHIIHHVAAGLEKMLMKCIELASSSSPFDDSRLWDTTSYHFSPPPPPPPHNLHLPQVDPRLRESIPPYPMPGAPVHDGHGPIYIHQQTQQGYPPHPTSHMGPPPITSSAPPSVGSTAEAMYSQALGGGQPMYEANGQYFPMHMGIFDFLSPQLPY